MTKITVKRDDDEGAPGKGALSRRLAAMDDGYNPGDDDIKEMLPKGLARTFVQSQLRAAKAQLAEHGLEAPSDYEGVFPQLPDDIDATDYSELSNLLLALQNAYSTTVWVQSYHYIWSGTFEEIAQYVEAVAATQAEGPNEQMRRASVKMDDKVVFFRARYKEHYNSYVRFRDLAHTLDGKIKAVSRVLGFKDEDEHATELSAIKRRGSSRRPRSK